MKLNGLSSIHLRLTSVLLAALVIIVSVCIFTEQLKKNLQAQNVALESLVGDAMLVDHYSETLSRNIGYGGFIHNFKNYILRGDAKYANDASTNLQLSFQALDNLSEVSGDYIRTDQIDPIRSTLTQYAQALLEVQALEGTISVAELDQLARIDDTKALQSLIQLHETATRLLDEHLELNRAELASTKAYLNYSFLLVAVIALAAAFILNLVYRSERVNETLAKINSQINLLIDQNPDGVVLMDDQGLIIRVNEQAAKLFGYTTSELELLKVDNLLPEGLHAAHPEHRKSFQTGIDKRVMASGRELKAVRKDGSEISLEISLNPFQLDGRSVVLASCRDVGDLLAAKVALEGAVKEAERAGSAKTDFLASMSHELRTPLNPIIGFADLMKDALEENPDAKIDKSFVDLISDSAYHLLALLNDILDFSKIGSEGVNLNLQPVAINEITQNLRSMFDHQAAEVGITLEAESQNLPDIIMADDKRVRQIIYNLLGNALKFGAGGTVKVTASSEPIEGRSVRIIIEVKDTGIGIPEDKLESIFTPFKQADQSTARTYGGTGLGLSICRKLAHAMDGDITAESTLGEGSTFRATFVAEDISEIYGMSQPARGQHNEVHDLSGSMPKHVLVVDDISVNGSTAKSILKTVGIETSWIDSGTKVIQELENGNYDLILMDLHMPRMNGEEATQRIRDHSEPRIAEIPVVLWTADVMMSSHDNKSTLWDGLLLKPTRTEELISQIRLAYEKSNKYI